MNEPTYTIDFADLMRESLDDLELSEFEEIAEYASELETIDTMLEQKSEQER